MKKSKVGVIKFLIFTLGLIIYTIAYLIATDGKDSKTVPMNVQYLWIMIGVDYIFLSVPFLVKSITISSFTLNAPSIILIWGADIFFCVSSLVIASLSYRNIIGVRVAVIIDLIMFFFVVIVLFIAALTSDHVKAVVSKEEGMLKRTDEIKRICTLIKQSLLLEYTNSFNSETKDAIAKVADDMLYLSPVNTKEAADIETSILEKLVQLQEILQNKDEKISEKDAKGALKSLTYLVKERKLMVN